jgi:ABC-type transport system substrate-binding protein
MMNHDVDAGWPPTRDDIPILQAADWTIASTGTPPIWTCCANDHDGEPGVLGWVNMLGYGGTDWHNIWCKLFSRREHEDGTPYSNNIWLMDGDPVTLNPLMSNTNNAWQVLSLVYSTLLQENPYTLDDIPWCVTEMPVIQNWNGTHREVSPGVWFYDPSPIGVPPGAPITGEVMTWTLRDDMTWHDGTPVTSADVEFCLDLLVDQNNAKYAATHALIWDVNVLGTYTFEIYYLGRAATAPNDISDIALLAPKHIWGPYIAGQDQTLWTIDDNDHRFWDGSDWISEDWSPQAGGDYTAPSINTPSGSVQLTHLQGNGPFVYPYGGWVPGQSIRLIRWYDPSTGTGWHYTRILRGDNNLDGRVDIKDLWASVYASGSMSGMPKWNSYNAGLKADQANPSGLIDGRDRLVICNDWSYYWYPESTLPP